ncbi:hypothetical protein [Mycobacterium sp. TY813]|uniref:hypothetical protein n=1 Tax=Mycobacterium TaxID=1763 RepID=UPI002741E3CA|nr:hypothetical protein [Mycobacterium sp. TY813]MDP7731511.1 hypothetical protein [Mycobacterium sp. TY813]
MSGGLKDWAPMIAPTLALIGVLITVNSASRTYRRGQAESRKDRQRDLIAKLIMDIRHSLEIFVPAAGKFQKSDLIEYLGTDSGRRHGELNNAVQEATVKALCEIGNTKLRPLIIELALQHRGLMKGDDAEPLHNHRLGDDKRFEAVLVVLKRVWAMQNTCSVLEVAAIEVLPVEIELPTFRSRLQSRRKARRSNRLKRWTNIRIRRKTNQPADEGREGS